MTAPSLQCCFRQEALSKKKKRTCSDCGRWLCARHVAESPIWLDLEDSVGRQGQVLLVDVCFPSCEYFAAIEKRVRYPLALGPPTKPEWTAEGEGM